MRLDLKSAKRFFALSFAVGLFFAFVLGNGCFGQDNSDEIVQQEEGEKVVEGAEDDEAEAKVVAVENWHFQPGKILGAKKFHLTQVFQVELELIERLCEPTPEQMAKLRVGQKGVVKKLTEEWKQKNRQMLERRLQIAGQRKNNNGEGEQQAEIGLDTLEIEEIADVDEIPPHVWDDFMTEAGNPFRFKAPEQHVVWTNLVSGILTQEQNQKLIDHKLNFEKERRQEMLEYVLKFATRELSLVEQQQVKLREILIPHFEDLNIFTPPFFEPFVALYYATKVTNQELETVLSSAQIQKWKLVLLPGKEIAEMLEEDDGDDDDDDGENLEEEDG